LLSKDLQQIVKNKIAIEHLLFIDNISYSINNNKGITLILEALCKYCSELNVDKLLLKYFKKLNFTENLWAINNKLEFILMHLKKSQLTINFIKENFFEIFENYLKSIDETEQADNIPALFDQYDQNYEEFVETDRGRELILGPKAQKSVNKLTLFSGSHF
jgi:hypothetical protein